MAKQTYMQENGNVFATAYPEYHQQAKKLTQAEGKRLYRAQAVETLRAMLKPGQTVYTELVSRSRSGMSRVVKLHIVENGIIRNISGYAATALDWSGDQGGIKIGGCGMDMGFHAVYTLGRIVWPQGTPEPHGTRNGEPDTDGGYALKHSWL